MVSEKAILVILIIAILLSVFSIILTASINIRTPINIATEKTSDLSSGKISLVVLPPPSPTPTAPPTGRAG